MVERTPFTLLIFAGLIFVVFIMMLVSVLPKQTVVFTDEENAIRTGIQEYDPVLGSPKSPIVITHFSDFLCENCADVATALSNLSKEFPEEIAIVWKDFPNIDAHPLAPSAAIAARCAGKQDTFWEYHDLLFANQRDVTLETAGELYTTIAQDLGLGMWRFNRCMNKQQTFEDVEMSYQDGIDLELISAPTIDINGQRYTGSLSEQQIRSIILNLEIVQ